MKIQDIPNLSQPAIRALNNAGFFTLKELSGHSQSDLLKLHGFGKSGIKIVNQSLVANNLKKLEQ